MSTDYQIPGRVPNDGVQRTAVSTFWRERFTAEPYYTEGDRFEDFESAYYAGHEARVREYTRAYEEVEAELQQRWEHDHRDKPGLGWDRARHAIRRAWDEAGKLVSGTSQDR